jgi:hypothetical protein
MSREDPIDAFWQWWAEARGPLYDAIATRTLDAWVDPISARVRAIDERLEWELGPGTRSEHHFCLSGCGDARLRVLTQRWLSRAPEPDDRWEYYPARQPSGRDPKLVLELAGVRLPYWDLRLGMRVDEARRRIDVVVFHPKFTDLPEDKRAMAMFLLLDDALGEDGVERWIGRAEHALEEGGADAPREALLDAVRALARAPAGQLSLLRGRGKDGLPRLAAVAFGVKRLDHLLMESHVEVTIAYPTERADGFYSEGVGEDVNAMEDALLAALGNDAVYIAHETGGGRRIIHLHVAPAGPAQEAIARWERMHSGWDIEVVARADPQWTVLRRW